MQIYKRVSFLLFLLLFSLGCAKRVSIKPSETRGIYHRVEKGQTLWRISKAYDIDVAVLVKANCLPDPSEISSGQLIFIPGAKKERIVPESISYSSRQGFIWPLEGEIVSFYGMESNGVKTKGINILSEDGVPVKAVKDGKVSFADEKVKGKGKVIIIDHLDGYLTLYAHNSQLLVSPGDMVKQGQTIAKTGKTGRVDSTQLYFEIRKGHFAKNPFYYLP